MLEDDEFVFQADNLSGGELAAYDMLTGLYSYTGLEQRARQGRHYRMAVGVLDISEFSMVNFIMGHCYADSLLAGLGRVIKRHLHEGEFAGRVYGDRFIICLHVEDLRLRLKLLIDECKASVQTYPLLMKGGAAFWVEGESFTKACEHALIALRNCFHDSNHDLVLYTDEMGAANYRQKKIENDFLNAVDGQNLQLYLQPKRYLHTDRWCGAEALARWHHPELGLVEPDDFVKVLEKNGTIGRLDLYILEKVCSFIRQRLREGKMVQPISVNLSRRHVISRTLLTDISRIVGKYSVPHHYLEFELTERVIHQQEDLLADRLQQLHLAGYKISLDDFGVGYSSLSFLSKLPFDVVKLDKSFVKNSLKHTPGFIADIVRMIHHLEMKVVLEGVETKEELQFAQEAGCDLVQGFYFAKPMPEEKYKELVYA